MSKKAKVILKAETSPVSDTHVNETTNASFPEVKLVFNEPLSLNLDFGRQDLNENFLKIQEAINKLKKC